MACCTCRATTISTRRTRTSWNRAKPLYCGDSAFLILIFHFLTKMESDSSPHIPSLLERITHWLMREPEDREQLIELLHGAYENSLMDADALAMIEGVLQVSEMSVGECVNQRAGMGVVGINDAPE